MRAFVVGPVTQYSTETAAWKAVSTLRLDINHHTFRPEGQPETFEQLVEHYRMIELDLEKESERKVHQTKQTYGVYLKTRIVPRWGGQPFREIRAVTVERWLGSIDDMSSGTKEKIKGVMSEVFSARDPVRLAQRWGEPHVCSPSEHQADAGDGTSGSGRVPGAHSGVATQDAHHWHRGSYDGTSDQRGSGPQVEGHRLEGIADGSHPVSRRWHRWKVQNRDIP
jgi:hypothetical protein